MNLNRQRHAGFTLIEMMCAVAVAGVLSSVAYPGFTKVLHKARRSDAHVALTRSVGRAVRLRNADVAALVVDGALGATRSRLADGTVRLVDWADGLPHGLGRGDRGGDGPGGSG